MIERIKLIGGSHNGSIHYADPRPGFVKLAKRIRIPKFNPNQINRSIDMNETFETYIIKEVWTSGSYTTYEATLAE